MRITFDRRETTDAELQRAIEALGYRVDESADRRIDSPAHPRMDRFTVPENAPTFLQEAVSRARAGPRPLVIGFSVIWCAPCRRLKSETLQSPPVAAVLSKVEFVSIDLDVQPELGQYYNVASVPLVLFVDADGRVVDQLEGFEPPEPFLVRLNRTLQSGGTPPIDRGRPCRDG